MTAIHDSRFFYLSLCLSMSLRSVARALCRSPRLPLSPSLSSFSPLASISFSFSLDGLPFFFQPSGLPLFLFSASLFLAPRGRAENYAYLNVDSSDTVNFLRPLARRAANTLRPLAVDIRWRKPCLLILFRREGWNVLFIAITLSVLYFYPLCGLQRYNVFSFPQNFSCFLLCQSCFLQLRM